MSAHHHHLMGGVELSPPQATALIERRCSVCHSTVLVYSAVGTPEDWQALVARMMYHHKAKVIAHATDDEAASIARFLSATQRPQQAGVRIGSVPTGRPL